MKQHYQVKSLADEQEIKHWIVHNPEGLDFEFEGRLLGEASHGETGTLQVYETISGRFVVTQAEADKYSFKVPGLRNVAKTGPYLHDGSVATLDEMVRLMVAHQTPRGELQPNEVEAIVAFLDSLTGEPPAELIAEPSLPQSGPDTPGPDPA